MEKGNFESDKKSKFRAQEQDIAKHLLRNLDVHNTAGRGNMRGNIDLQKGEKSHKFTLQKSQHQDMRRTVRGEKA